MSKVHPTIGTIKVHSNSDMNLMEKVTVEFICSDSKRQQRIIRYKPPKGRTIQSVTSNQLHEIDKFIIRTEKEYNDIIRSLITRKVPFIVTKPNDPSSSDIKFDNKGNELDRHTLQQDEKVLVGRWDTPTFDNDDNASMRTRRTLSDFSDIVLSGDIKSDEPSESSNQSEIESSRNSHSASDSGSISFDMSESSSTGRSGFIDAFDNIDNESVNDEKFDSYMQAKQDCEHYQKLTRQLEMDIWELQIYYESEAKRSNNAKYRQTAHHLEGFRQILSNATEEIDNLYQKSLNRENEIANQSFGTRALKFEDSPEYFCGRYEEVWKSYETLAKSVAQAKESLESGDSLPEEIEDQADL